MNFMIIITVRLSQQKETTKEVDGSVKVRVRGTRAQREFV